jgi:hypothetical protein
MAHAVLCCLFLLLVQILPACVVPAHIMGVVHIFHVCSALSGPMYVTDTTSVTLSDLASIPLSSQGVPGRTQASPPHSDPPPCFDISRRSLAGLDAAWNRLQQLLGTLR